MADNELQSKELEKDDNVRFPLEARVSLLSCSTCGEKPELEVTEAGFIISCNFCGDKYRKIEGTCYDTFPWNDIDEAITEWNELAQNKNSWYKKEYIKPLQLKML